MSGRRGKAHKGIYRPINEHKYNGNPNNITYRSSWEKFIMKYFDYNKNVKTWSSEEIVIPYYYPVDERMHRYFPDFLIEFTNGKKVLIEVKPYNETQEPILKKHGNKRVFQDRMETYIKNCAKWSAAKEYCKNRGWEFSIFTEHHLKRLR